MNQNEIKILFLGDIVGRPGRKIVKNYLLALLASENKPDFIIANVENASHGFGLTQKNHDELLSLGIDAFTSGNHIWDKKEIFNYIDDTDNLIRPANYPEGTRGIGSAVFDKGSFKVGVINLLGQVFMSPIESPWKVIQNEIEKLKQETNIIIVDFHAEATAEKICFGTFCSKLGVSAVLGTHTHVQTADEKILNSCTAYITDVGFCGATGGVIGMDYDTSFRRLSTGLPERFDIAESEEYELNAVLISTDCVSGKSKEIKRIMYENVCSEENVC